ncbi:hypothetical protein GUJ93_ZPchr0010g7403 [Zizania palustris]|uniref:Uncharacterized protein n=1 Tax=Zizania palustris TaxID=103762 RepID=A0A8J5VVQ9_ZIZPA|nr:hypothetical protein GUJ93_ZPchr0010g7403 [Zizania palustris]
MGASGACGAATPSDDDSAWRGWGVVIWRWVDADGRVMHQICSILFFIINGFVRIVFLLHLLKKRCFTRR